MKSNASTATSRAQNLRFDCTWYPYECGSYEI